MSICNINPKRISNSLSEKIENELLKSKLFFKKEEGLYSFTHPSISEFQTNLLNINDFSLIDENNDFNKYPFEKELFNNTYFTSKLIKNNNLKFKNNLINNSVDKIITSAHSDLINDINNKLGSKVLTSGANDTLYLNISQPVLDKYMLHTDNAVDYLAERLREEYLSLFEDSRNLIDSEEFISHPFLNKVTKDKLISFALKINPNFRIGIVDNLSEEAVSLLGDHLILLRGDKIDSLPEELSHFYIGLLDDTNPIKQKLLKEVLNHPIYLTTLENYKNSEIYKKEGKIDFEKIKLEAAGKLIAFYIEKASEGLADEEFGKRRSFLRDLLNDFFKFIRNTINRIFPIFAEDVFLNSANQILNNDFTGLNRENLNNVRPYEAIFYSMTTNNMPENYELTYLQNLRKHAYYLNKNITQENLDKLDPEKFKDISEFAKQNNTSLKYNYNIFTNIIKTISPEISSLEEDDDYKIGASARLQIVKDLENMYINISELPKALKRTIDELKNRPLSPLEKLEVLVGYLKIKEHFFSILDESNTFMIHNKEHFKNNSEKLAEESLNRLIADSLQILSGLDHEIKQISDQALISILKLDTELAFSEINKYIQELSGNATFEENKQLHDAKLLNKVTTMEQVEAIITGKFITKDKNGKKVDYTNIADINTVQSLTFMLSSATELGDAPIVSIVKHFFDNIQKAKLTAIIEQQAVSRKINPLLQKVLDKNEKSYYNIFNSFQIPLSIDYKDSSVKRMFWVTEDDRITANLKIQEYEDYLNDFNNLEVDRQNKRKEYNDFLANHMWRKYTNNYYDLINEGKELNITKNNDTNKRIKEIRQLLISLYESYSIERYVEDFEVESVTSEKIRVLQNELVDLRQKLSVKEKEALDSYFKKLDDFLEIDVTESEKLQNSHKKVWITKAIARYKEQNIIPTEGVTYEQLAELAYTNIFTIFKGNKIYKDIETEIFKSGENQIISNYYENKIKELENEKNSILNNYRLVNSEIFVNSIFYSDNEYLMKIVQQIQELKDFKYKYIKIDTTNILAEDNSFLEREGIHYLHLILKSITDNNLDSVFLESLFSEEEILELKSSINSFNSEEKSVEDLTIFSINKVLELLNKQNKDTYSFYRILFNDNFFLSKQMILDFFEEKKETLSNNYNDTILIYNQALNTFVQSIYGIPASEEKKSISSKLSEISVKTLTSSYQNDVVLTLVNIFEKYKLQIPYFNNSESEKEELINKLDSFINSLLNQNQSQKNHSSIQLLQNLYAQPDFLPLLKEAVNEVYIDFDFEAYHNNVEDDDLRNFLIEKDIKNSEKIIKFVENFEKYHPLKIVERRGSYIEIREISNLFTQRIPKKKEHLEIKYISSLYKKKVKKEFTTPIINELHPDYISGKHSATVDMNGNFIPKLAKDGGSDEYKLKEYEELKKDKDLFNLYTVLKTEYYKKQQHIQSKKPDIIIPARNRDKYEEKADGGVSIKNAIDRTKELIDDNIKKGDVSSAAQEEGNISPIEIDQYNTYSRYTSNSVKLLTKRYLPAERQTKDVYASILDFINDENKYQAKLSSLPFAKMMEFSLSKTNPNSNTSYNKKRIETINEFIEGSIYNNAPDSFFNNSKFNPIINFINGIGSLSLGLFDYVGAFVNYMGGQNLMFIRNSNSLNPIKIGKQIGNQGKQIFKSLKYLSNLEQDLAKRDMQLSKETAFLLHIGAFSKFIDIVNKTSPLNRFASLRENLLLPRTTTEYAMGIQLALEIVEQEGKIEHNGQFYNLEDIYERDFEEDVDTGEKKLKLRDGFSKDLYDPMTGSYILKLREKITSWANNIQGNYQEDMLANINRYKAGQLYIFMKKWFFPNMQYVLGYEAPNLFRNEVQGGYVNTWFLLGKDIFSLIKSGNILKSPDLIKSYFKTDRTQQNLIKSLHHILLIASYNLLLFHILGFDSDDKDKYKKMRTKSDFDQLKILAFFKIQSELGTMLPLPFFGLGFKEFANTALQPLRGAYNTTINLSKVMKYSSYTIGEQLGGDFSKELYYDKSYGFWFREKGDSKLSATIWKMLGVSGARDNILGKIVDPDENYEGRADVYLRQLNQSLD